MQKKLLKKFFKIIIGLIILIWIFFVWINIYIINFSKDYILDLKKLDNSRKIALVLWAWIKTNKKPTDILKDRLNTAFLAYKSWKIKKIIVSWDNSKIYHNEPEVMRHYLVDLGVKKTDIYNDYAGFDTYDSIYRAKEIFQAKKIVIFTQKYHLYRAIYISHMLWIDSVWVISDKHKYLKINYFKFREFFSRIKAFFEAWILKSKPKFLWKKIEIK